MPKCPLCEKDIDHLKLYDTEEVSYEFGLDGGQGASYDAQTCIGETTKGSEEWECPSCGKTLFRTEADAIAFLQGKLSPETALAKAKACDIATRVDYCKAMAVFEKPRRGHFLSAVCEAYIRSDLDNARLMLPLMETLHEKYNMKADPRDF